MTKKKITNPHAPAAYTVSRSAIDAYPGDVIRFTAQVISTKGTPVLAAGRTGAWSIVAGSGGTLSATSGTTDAQGKATVELTVGSVVGTVYRLKFVDSEQLTGTSPNVTVVADPVQPPVDPTPPPIIVPDPPVPPVINPPATTDATLPRVFLTTTMASTPSLGTVHTVAAGDDLQAVLNAALPGDKIVLDHTGTWDGNYTLPAKTGGLAGGYITIYGDGGTPFPVEGVQITPTFVGSNRLPKIRALSVRAGIATDIYAKRWRLLGLEITDHPSAANNTWGLVAAGDAGDFQRLDEHIAEDIIIDRCYIHGSDAFDCKAGVRLNGRRCALIESWVSGIHSTFDAQAVSGWNGPGPFKIVNNYLDGSAENIAFGGSVPAVAGVIPSDIEIRRNHITKPIALKGSGWLFKNLLELKTAEYVLVEGNVFENSWPNGQAGNAIVLYSATVGYPTGVVAHVTIQKNVFKRTASWFQLGARYNNLAELPRMHHVTIRDNVGIALDDPSVTQSQGRLYQVDGQIDQLTIENNTGFSQSNCSFIWSGDRPLTDHIVRNNIAGGGQYQLFGSGGIGKPAWDVEAGPGSAFLGNVVVLGGSQPQIPGNSYPGAFADVGFAGGAAAATSLTATLADLTLTGGSAYHNAGTDGTDPGADMAAVAAAVAGVGGF